MPVELGTTTVTGQQSGPSLLSVPNGTVIGQPSMDEYDVLGQLIVVEDNVESWIADSKQKVDQQHKSNVAAIDSEIDAEVKAAGGLNVRMDISTPDQTVIKEKNILVKLYLTKQSNADGKSKDSTYVLNGRTDKAESNPSARNFIQASMKSVYVHQESLLGWARGYEASNLALVYSEMARRLNEKAQALDGVLAAQQARANIEAQRLSDAEARAGRQEVPMIPPGVSLDNNMIEAKALRESSKLVVGGEEAIVYGVFYTKVRNGGEWDYKQRGPQYEEVGNFNYGATGRAAGIPEQVLLRAAGAAQGIAGTSMEDFGKWWAGSPYGDDKVDQVWIKAGIEFAKAKGF